MKTYVDYFLMLEQDIKELIIYNEQKIICLKILETGNSKTRRAASAGFGEQKHKQAREGHEGGGRTYNKPNL